MAARNVEPLGPPRVPYVLWPPGCIKGDVGFSLAGEGGGGLDRAPQKRGVQETGSTDRTSTQLL